MEPQTPEPADALEPYDAVLLLSFGGPDSADEVMPFLENVTRGRGIPPQRLHQVAEHYLQLGGHSPINGQNRALRSALQSELDRRGLDRPVLWGNRNWHPFLVDALRQLHEDGARRVVVVTTSAYSSYSSCRQYREDLALAVQTLTDEGRRLDVDKIRPYFNLPGFVEPVVTSATAALQRLAEAGTPGDAVRLVFVTHSLPTAMAQASGPDGADAYLAQHQDVATTVADGVAERLGRSAPVRHLAFCSRSGPPAQPWLEPDVNDLLRTLPGQGVSAVLLIPVGFVSDHMEVVYDLDTEAAATAAGLGLELVRLPTVGTDPAFVAGIVDLLVERAAQRRGDPVTPVTVGFLPASDPVCPADCCSNLRGARPALCEAVR